MTADELRELAGYLISRGCSERCDHDAADFLRACADAQEKGPVAWRYKVAQSWSWQFHGTDPANWRDPYIVTCEELYPIAMPAQAQPLRLPKPMTDDELERTWLGAYGIMAALRTIEAETMRRVKEANK